MVKFFQRFFCAIIFVTFLFPYGVVSATTIINNSTARMYALNNILGYDECVGSSSKSSSTMESKFIPGQTLPENGLVEKLYNKLVKLDIAGVSDKPEVLIGIVANAQRESGSNPFNLNAPGNNWGLWQFTPSDGNTPVVKAMINKINEKYSSYWGLTNITGIPEKAIDEAMDIEIDTLINGWSGWPDFIANLNTPTNQTGLDGAIGYGELFQVIVENNFTHTGSDPITDPGVKAIAPYEHYTDMHVTRDYAANIYNQYATVTKSTSEEANESAPSTTSSSGYDRLKDTVRKYYKKAMEAQEQFGTPWEMVFAQMQVESGMGTAGVAVSGADNNWLGITGEGDAGSYPTSNHTWAKYTSVGASIADWAGKRVLRNGYYDNAYQYLSLNNYNLEEFVKAVIKVYAPSNDGNDPNGYAQKVLTLINGPIREVREELGLPSSEKYAKKKNIDASTMVVTNYTNSGYSTGEYEIETATYELCGKQSTSTKYDPTSGTKIAQTAVNLAWPYDDGTCISGGNKIKWQDKNSCNDTPRPEYKKIMDEVLHSSYYKACNWFVLAVMAKANVDPSYPRAGLAEDQLKYLEGQAKNSDSIWMKVDHGSDPAILKPGDIMVKPDHIQIYTGEYGYGDTVVASAHLDSAVGNSQSVYNDISNVNVFRLKNASNVSGDCDFNDPNGEGCIFYCQKGGESWEKTPYGINNTCSTYGTAGCGPSSLAMTIANLTGDPSITPVTIGEQATAIGARGCSGGSSIKIIELVTRYNLQYRSIPWNKNSIDEALDGGAVVYVSAGGHSPFSSEGHYIAIRGKTSSGKWLLFNSAWDGTNNCTKGSYAPSKKEWDPQTLINAAQPITGGPYAIYN